MANYISITELASLKSSARWAYTLFCIGFFLFPSSLAAVILAYWKKSSAEDTYVQSHLALVRKAFWIKLLTVAAVIIVSVYSLNFAFLPALLFLIWVIYKFAKGFWALSKDRPVA